MNKISDYRKMRILLMFDLPSVEKDDIANNQKLQQIIKKRGTKRQILFEFFRIKRHFDEPFLCALVYIFNLRKNRGLYHHKVVNNIANFGFGASEF